MEYEYFIASFSVRDVPQWFLYAVDRINSAWWRGHRAGTLRLQSLDLSPFRNGRGRITLYFVKRSTHSITLIDSPTPCGVTSLVFHPYQEIRFQDIVPSKVRLRRDPPSVSLR